MPVDSIVRRFSGSHFLVLEARRSRRRARRALLVPAERVAGAIDAIASGRGFNDDLELGAVALSVKVGLGARAAMSALAQAAEAAQGAQSSPGGDPNG